MSASERSAAHFSYYGRQARPAFVADCRSRRPRAMRQADPQTVRDTSREPQKNQRKGEKRGRAKTGTRPLASASLVQVTQIIAATADHDSGGDGPKQNYGHFSSSV